MGKQEPGWYTDKHRRLAEAEKARQRWMIETSQWPYERNGDRFPPLGSSASWPKLIIATLIIVFLMELMLQRSLVDSPVTDELIGMPADLD